MCWRASSTENIAGAPTRLFAPRKVRAGRDAFCGSFRPRGARSTLQARRARNWERALHQVALDELPICIYNVFIDGEGFEWAEKKNAANRAKHGVDFETAKLVFDDPLSIAFPERSVEGEERWQAWGTPNGIALLVVAYTVVADGTEETIRIVSARAATPSEWKKYEANP